MSLKKSIVAIGIALTLGLGTQSPAHSAVVIATGGGVGAYFATSGLMGLTLCMAAEGHISRGNPCEIVYQNKIASMLFGLILLDGENGQEIEFRKMAHDDLLKINLSEDEARAYNENTEELTQAFKIVSSDLTKNSKIEDAKQLWDEQEAILGTDTINGARKVLANALKK